MKGVATMKLFKKLLVLTLALSICLLPRTSLAQAEVPSKQTLDRIDDYVKRQFQNNRVIGGSYAIVFEGKVIASGGIGVADRMTKEPVTPETIYSTASVTKALTAAAILHLYEEGKVGLDIPVKNYIPWFTYKDRTRSAKVTIRHLLTHSAGINRFEGDGAVFSNEEQNRNSLEDSIRSLGTVSMTSDPGTQGAYCNSCYNTLGLVIEKVTNTDYETFMKDELFAPLKMEHTTFDPSNAEQVASEYNWVFGLKHKSAYNNAVFGESQNPEGGIYSNVLDLSKFLSAMLGVGENPILSKETLQSSQQGEVETGSDGSKYSASGFEEGTIHHTRVLYKSGDGIGSTAKVLLIPDRKLGISLLVGDSIPEFGDPLAVGIAQILLGETPSDIDVGITFWRLVGILSIGFTVIGLILLVLLVKSILSLRTSSVRLGRRWLLVCRAVIFSIASFSIAYLMIAVHPSQIGFYGYPYDLAAGLLSIIISAGLWAIYSVLLLIVNRNQERE
jgi:CubicO group peptidase (beta-lactamase class C family)